MPVAIGSRLGPYEIVSNLGAGGMGEVYRARDPRIGRDVAIKVLPASLANDADRLRRFEQEARATGTLNHPNLLVIFDFGSHDQSPFIVSELLEGATLRDVLRDKLSMRKALDYAVQIANGLAAAHEKGVVHRDLKPENIFITRDDRVKLLDFGLAKLTIKDAPEKSTAETEQRGTSPGVVVGTVGYMSPEQVRGTAIDHRSDIFSFGIVLYEMIAGSQPFRRDSSVETMNAILHDDAPPLRDDIPPLLARLLEHALEKNPSQRFESAKDVAFALDAISGSGEVSAVRAKSKSRKAKSERPKEVAYSRITFRRGFIMTARFAPDGSIVYGAAWEDKPLEVFTSHPPNPESRPLGRPDADLLDISRTGELAFSLGRKYVAGWITSGTLARMPMGGGAPRIVCENVEDAAFTRDGKELVVCRNVGGLYRIESPVGNVIYQSSRWLSFVRPSPEGERFAFLDHPIWGDNGAALVVVDRNGKELVRSQSSWNAVGGVAWLPRGDEVWVAATASGAGRDIVSIGMSGKEKLVLATHSHVTLQDIAADGRVLLTFENGGRETVAGHRGDTQERNLSWFDWTWLSDLSKDGKVVLLSEQADAVRGRNTVYVRPVDGTPAIQIGEGHARGKPLSADGRWIVTEVPDGMELTPIGPGQPQPITIAPLEKALAWQLTPDNQRLIVLGNEPGKPMHLFELPIDGSSPAREISPIVAGWPLLLSNAADTVAAMGPDDRVLLFPIHGGDARPVANCGAGDVPIGWSTDDRALYVMRRGRVTVTIERAEIDGSARTPWLTIRPGDPAGILDLFPVQITPDGETYAYSYRRFLSNLYVINGLI
jgi:eukaryotic-like serine/threonine-protein kinase